MKALILAAGTASRLRPLTEHTPKCLLRIGERTLLERSVDALVAAGVDELCIVTGYLHSMIEDFVASRYPSLAVRFIHNADFASTNNIYSLFLARPFAEGSDVLLLDSDLLYDPAIPARVLASPEPNVLTMIRHELGEEEIKIVVDGGGQIVELNKTCNPREAIGESLGIERMGAAYTAALYPLLERMMTVEHLENKFYELAFERMIGMGHRFSVLDVSDLFSCELDTVADFENARALIPPALY